jgi:hypothetical protein
MSAVYHVDKNGTSTQLVEILAKHEDHDLYAGERKVASLRQILHKGNSA